MPLQFVMALPVADVAGNPIAVSVPASPPTLYDKIDEYPTANDADYFWGGGADPLQGLYGFVLDPAALSGIPGGWHITAVEAVARLYSPEQGQDQLDRIDVADAGLATTGQSDAGPVLNQGWGTYVLPINRVGGGGWLASDLVNGFIGLFDFTRGIQVGQLYFRYYIARPHASLESLAPYAEAEGLAPGALGAGLAPAATAISLSPSGAPSGSASTSMPAAISYRGDPASRAPMATVANLDNLSARPASLAPAGTPASVAPAASGVALDPEGSGE